MRLNRTRHRDKLINRLSWSDRIEVNLKEFFRMILGLPITFSVIVLYNKLYNKTNKMHFLEFYSISIVVAASPHDCVIHTINCMYSRIAS